MKIVGLITEYNPFHLGHRYHIEQAKKITGADYVVVVMSGDFVQRGAPAIMSKHLRAEAALRCGASLVIELPISCATGTAEQFAFGAVSLLHKLGCVDSICFGSESGDIHAMSQLAQILVDESTEYKEHLQQSLRAGMSFPAAREAAILCLYPNESYADLLKQPNNILGIEYLKALIRLKSTMRATTIMRMDGAYHDTDLSEQFSSATAVRQAMLNQSFSSYTQAVPQEICELYQKHEQKTFPICRNDFSLLLKYRLLHETKSSLLLYADVSVELANRICNRLNEFQTYEQFCELLKTKELTYSRISRALLHILLDIKKTDSEDITYAKMLGFSNHHTELLSVIKEHSSIPLLSKPSEEYVSLATIYRVSNIYESVVADKFHKPFINEYKRPIVRV